MMEVMRLKIERVEKDLEKHFSEFKEVMAEMRTVTGRVTDLTYAIEKQTTAFENFTSGYAQDKLRNEQRCSNCDVRMRIIEKRSQQNKEMLDGDHNRVNGWRDVIKIVWYGIAGGLLAVGGFLIKLVITTFRE